MTLQLDNIRVVKGYAEILRGISLTLLPGRFTALCGPNGAGKTTALNVITGAIKQTSGSASLDGQAIQGMNTQELARRRAVVSQQSLLTFPFEVHEVVAMGRAPHFGKTTPVHDLHVVGEALALMELTELAERRYTTLSGGERQRVQIARALAQVWGEPEGGSDRWLMLDEPTAALDLKHQIALMKLLEELAKKGWGIAAVLHDLHLVKDHADDVVLFKDGAIAATGAAEELLTADRIATVFDLSEPYSLA